jgi:hypothetical protein
VHQATGFNPSAPAAAKPDPDGDKWEIKFLHDQLTLLRKSVVELQSKVTEEVY